MKILSIVGARPQFIKAAMLSKALRSHCQEVILHTGQHYDPNMSGVFFEELDMPRIDINLNVGSGSHGKQTGKIMVGIEQVIEANHLDWVLVYGDTNSTLAAALTAAKSNIPLAHVEAGLRSYNRAMPEEINRVVCDMLSSLLFCPTQVAVENLSREGINSGVHVVGDIMADALFHFLPVALARPSILKKYDLKKDGYALATIHRAANTDDPERLSAIMAAFKEIKSPILLPLHPRTKSVIDRLQIGFPANVLVVEPVGYLDMLLMEHHASCILTDSGGIQKEAYWLGVRCITLREETEWVETVECGWNQLAGTDTQRIIKLFQNWHPDHDRPAFYGDGHTAERIVAILCPD
jgi:UDP-N-acetylglucosamine 2-epimerase